MKRAIPLFALAMVWAAAPAMADYPWKNHAPPYDFLFGNDFDTHQQTQRDKAGVPNLAGYLYITYTGATSQDGFRVATHKDCNANPCEVGWHLQGSPGNGTFVYHQENDHETFLVDRADIPQPGTPSHFHWLGGELTVGETKAGYFLELQVVATFCFVHHGVDSFNPALTCENDANNGIIVRSGTDIATHVNIVGSYPGY